MSSNQNEVVLTRERLRLRHANWDKLSSLWLDSERLNRCEWDTFAGLTRLEELYLHANELDVLEDTRLFRDLVSLRQLSLWSNRLRQIHAASFGFLRVLEKLYLSSNDLTRLEPTMFAPLINLRVLYLDANRIRRIEPNTFASLSQLEKLVLTGNEIDEVDVRGFSGLVGLRVLLLNNNKLARTQRACFQSLSSSKIGFIDLRNNSFTNPIVVSYFNSTVLDPSEVFFVDNSWRSLADVALALSRTGGFKSSFDEFLTQFGEGRNSI